MLTKKLIQGLLQGLLIAAATACGGVVDYVDYSGSDGGSGDERERPGAESGTYMCAIQSAPVVLTCCVGACPEGEICEIDSASATQKFLLATEEKAECAAFGDGCFRCEKP
jgi:hypothetical protein